MAEQTTISKPSRQTHRQIRERWVIKGNLVFETPVHFGGGEADNFTDMPILMDELEQKPLLPGTSIAGALRNYLRERQRGDGTPFPSRPKEGSDEEKEEIFQRRKAKEQELAATLLFGGYRGDDEGLQSPLIIDDSIGENFRFELRDGVAIDGTTRTAANDKKFDMELLAAGTIFPLRFELIVRAPIPEHDEDSDEQKQKQEAVYAQHRQNLLNALATTLEGLSVGEITFGARKRRGFGQGSVKEWTVQHYDLTQVGGLLAWLADGRDQWTSPVESNTDKDIRAALNESIIPIADKRQRVTLTAEFGVNGSLLIRSGFAETETAPDMTHLHSYRPDSKNRVPVVPGTSWAGALRQRAVKIVKTLAATQTGDADTIQNRATKIVDGIFGPAEIERDDRNVYASRLSVAESRVSNGHSLVQTRVSIDRFTGGALESHLFDQQPLYGDEDTRLTLALTLRPPSPNTPEETESVKKYELGLLLLLLKDLWTGDLRVGGEASVGRGKLRGLAAELETPTDCWTFTATKNGLDVAGSDKSSLQLFVNALNEEVMKDV